MILGSFSEEIVIIVGVVVIVAVVGVVEVVAVVGDVANVTA
jgi:hypothetical protein